LRATRRRRDKHGSEVIRLRKLGHQPRQIERYLLVLRNRRWAHVEFSFQNLVSAAVIRKRGEITTS
jgi:hypothetical protein